MSPFEHQAQVVAPYTDHKNEFGDTVVDGEPDRWSPPFGETWHSRGSNSLKSAGYFCGNFRAPWLQYRKTLPGEAVFQERDAT